MEKDQQKDTSEKKNYEVSFLVPAEENAANVLRLVGQHGIDIRSEGQVRKILLAYKIKHFTQAFLGSLVVSAFPENIKSLERDVHTSSAVLRFLIINLPVDRAAAESGRTSQKPVMRKTQRPKETYQQVKPLSNEALEKKIEEILQ